MLSKPVQLVAFILFLGLQLHAQQFNVLTYGGISSTMSGEIILLIEEAAQSSNGQIKILNIETGLAYRKKASYFIPQANSETLDQDQLNKLNQLPVKSATSLQLIESTKAFLIFSAETPEPVVEFLKQRRSTMSIVNSTTRYWDDLKFGRLSYIEKKENQLVEFNTNKPEWQSDSEWRLSYYMKYRLSYEGHEFIITIFPKSFGEAGRLVNVLKKEKTNDSIILSTGNIVAAPDDKSNSQFDLSIIEKVGEQIVNVGPAELVGLKDIVEPYMQSPNKADHPIQFVSSNICLKNSGGCDLVFEPFTILYKNGFKIAVVGVSSPSTQAVIEKNSRKYSWLKNYFVQDPGVNLRDKILPLLHSQVDFVFILTNMNAEEYGQLLPYLNGSDIAILNQERQYSLGENNTYRFSQYKSRLPQLPLLNISVGDLLVVKNTFSKKDKDLTINLKKVFLDQSVPSGEYLLNGNIKNFTQMIYRKNVILPDHRILYPDKVVPSKEEFATLAAEIMRRKMGAEVGVFNIKNQDSTMVGAQDKSVVRTWVRDDEELQIMYLSGRDIKKLIQANKNVVENFKLSIVGVDDKSRIDKISIQDSELYRVVLSSAVTLSFERYGLSASKGQIGLFRQTELGYVDDNDQGKSILLADFLVDNLQLLYEKSILNIEPEKLMQSAEKYRELYEGRSESEQKGYWIHDLKKIGFEFSQVSTSDVSAFTNVQDNRLQSVDQRYLSGNLTYTASYRKYPLINEVGTTMSYSKLELLPSNAAATVNTLNDEIRFFVNTTLPVYNLKNTKWLGEEMGPFVELAYDTEFEKDPDQELKQNGLSFLGWKILNGDFVKNSSLSLMYEKRFAVGSERNATGVNLRFELGSAFFENQAQYKASCDYRYFFDYKDSLNADLASRLSLDQSFEFNLSNKISFGPFLKYLSLNRKIVNETVNQTLVGINFNYTNSWKPHFSPSKF